MSQQDSLKVITGEQHRVQIAREYQRTVERDAVNLIPTNSNEHNIDNSYSHRGVKSIIPTSVCTFNLKNSALNRYKLAGQAHRPTLLGRRRPTSFYSYERIRIVGGAVDCWGNVLKSVNFAAQEPYVV